jgi:hypothetical protein
VGHSCVSTAHRRKVNIDESSACGLMRSSTQHLATDGCMCLGKEEDSQFRRCVNDWKFDGEHGRNLRSRARVRDSRHPLWSTNSETSQRQARLQHTHTNLTICKTSGNGDSTVGLPFVTRT